ncbi:hypothetical protein ACFFIX_08210 [Metabacillus herbersteinensis]|uniref:Group-specific protein n=1 Tax=Metabacillus herbersteinensis TaxID=283816 RepID=A0ABV6GCN8_9BACI
MEDNQSTLIRGVCQFVFPISLIGFNHEELSFNLEKEGFKFFSLKNSDHESEFYGTRTNVPHSDNEHYFLPYIENILFQDSFHAFSLNRFSKMISNQCTLITPVHTIPFSILSIDLIICPFNIGLITVRTELPANIPYLVALDFMNHFRVLAPKITDQKGTILTYNEKTFSEMKKFILDELCPGIIPYLNDDERNTTNGSLPYFVDERMFVSGYLLQPNSTTIDEYQLFKVSHLNSYDDSGNEYISASNPDYISEHIKNHSYDRWAPNTYYVTSDHTFTCVSKDEKNSKQLLNNMYGPHYYNLLLHLFYKIVLLKLSYDYSKLDIDRKEQKIEDLIRSITNFSAKFIFFEISSRTEGQEISNCLKQTFKIEPLFDEVKNTLNRLYQNQERLIDKRKNQLLLILTIYTVISGIYGMNLVVEDWKGNIDWSKLLQYSVFEYISLFIAISGITVGFLLGLIALYKMAKEYYFKEKKNN